jgi:8-oxo-dGTP diphosphatase
MRSLAGAPAIRSGLAVMAEDGPQDRLYPPRPILAVSVAVFRQGRVLVGRRARPPLAGRFSLPGGVVEVGETMVEAASRELYEEVGVECAIIGFNRHVEPIVREGGRVRAHFVIASFVARWTRGEARVSEEIDAVAWIEPDGLASLLTTPELSDVIAAAQRIESSTR